MDEELRDERADPVLTESFERLESWKEIAAYLKRDTRTVQRWEKREGLPIHRHVHDKLGTVYAFPTELDRWWRERGARVDADAVRSPEPPPLNAPVSRPRPPFFSFRRLLFAGVVALLLFVPTSVWFFYQNPSGVRSEQPMFQRSTVVEGIVGRVSPDGEWLAYFDAEERGLQIKSLSSGEIRTLFDGHSRAPVAWSPDSQRVAFVARVDESGAASEFEVRSIRISADESQVWWRGIAANLIEPQDWLDEDRIICRQRGRDSSKIFLLAQGVPSPQLLATVPGEVGTIQVSPNSKFIAYSYSRQNDRDIYVRALERDAGEIRITETPSQDGFPTWMPSGSTLIFVRQRGSSAALWAARISPQTGMREEEIFLRTLPGSRTRLTSITEAGQLHFSRRVRNPRVFLMSVDAVTGAPLGPPRSSLDDETADPVWVRRGGLSYRRTLPDNSTAFTLRNVQAGSRSEYQLPRSYTVDFLAHARDGHRFTFLGSDLQNRRGFFEYQPNSDEVRTVHLTDEDVRPPARWSPDHRELLYSAAPLQDGRHPVRIVNPATGVARTQILSSSRPFAKWSPDGKFIAYSDGGCLKVLPYPVGEPSTVLCAPSVPPPSFVAPAVGGLGWSPDGTKLAWVVHNAQQRRLELWIVNMRTAAKHVWPGETGYLSWPAEPAWSMSPDQLALRIEYRPQFEVWSFDNVLSATSR